MSFRVLRDYMRARDCDRIPLWVNDFQMDAWGLHWSEKGLHGIPIGMFEAESMGARDIDHMAIRVFHLWVQTRQSGLVAVWMEKKKFWGVRHVDLTSAFFNAFFLAIPSAIFEIVLSPSFFRFGS